MGKVSVEIVVFKTFFQQKAGCFRINGGFYGWKLSNIIPWWYVSHQASLTYSEIYPNTLLFFVKNQIFNILLQLIFRWKGWKMTLSLDFIGEKGEKSSPDSMFATKVSEE